MSDKSFYVGISKKLQTVPSWCVEGGVFLHAGGEKRHCRYVCFVGISARYTLGKQNLKIPWPKFSAPD